MSELTVSDLSALPAPQVVEALDYESVLSEIIADFLQRMQDAGQTFSAPLESDPIYKLAEAAAYREILIRQRVNDGAKAMMLAFAEQADLDQLGANVGVTRLVISPEDDTTVPVTPAVYEADEDLRARIQASPEGLSVAGPVGAYKFHAKSASGLITDIGVNSPKPAYVDIAVLTSETDGTASQAVIDLVTSALDDETIRPVADRVTVSSATIVNYEIDAVLIVSGPEAEPILAAAKANIASLVASPKLGVDIAQSQIYKALQVTGVMRVKLNSPAQDTILAYNQAANCTSWNVSVSTNDE